MHAIHIIQVILIDLCIMLLCSARLRHSYFPFETVVCTLNKLSLIGYITDGAEDLTRVMHSPFVFHYENYIFLVFKRNE